MALRIQRERIGNLDGIPGIDEYFATYGVSHESMKLARPDAIVMHPGPMNRGIEIEGSLADGPRSVITQQVTNGVAVRMAVLDRVGKTMAARCDMAPPQKKAQQNRDTIFVEDGEILSVERICGRPVHHAHSRAKVRRCSGTGQFRAHHLRRHRCRCAGRCRSCASVTTGSRFSTRLSARDCASCRKRTVGTEVSVLGPIGQPFRISHERPIRC